MGEKKIIIGIVLLTILILVGGIFLVSGESSTSAAITSSQNTKATVDNKNYDWGNIPFKGGNVSKTFTIKNTGTDTLKLMNIKTSCHCTKAQIKIGDTTSPSFGMNSVSSWIGEIPPGQEAELKVIFDPAYHGPQGVGPINRLVSVETNDSNNSRLEFSLTGTVIK
ncbi:MAG: hypothetical protein A2857_04855 [Candidatus Levybacteria bacterium RIFCSPHIGHO2_01_FULL_36_15]|nr:MAG: hypothetical protein A2857_04855 [Candidatus Levybacteria bacterium RIFCSPHIGHO2_01_FULL_36_15]OGH38578.1 MAG: hypothetical protein A2905_04035 [Candidatus Levybacteria bacterium RIFCSPLOWO2_01_FULL_36_10]